eukprot:CAMPEP_0176298404 /NCGR_PEP_ID=MMETSP0121_2-20121125/59233_1 /TAXON_ID=160619 /ORGANISM="Kryptoperidinium foliaceum, Strain CCMP 1326" /LENGTH=60 /DNA_ID=CAMNT_0017639649 /DNA_START=92 /DNA_END=271 /DNA_ORIENTATION=+
MTQPSEALPPTATDLPVEDRALGLRNGEVVPPQAPRQDASEELARRRHPLREEHRAEEVG